MAADSERYGGGILTHCSKRARRAAKAAPRESKRPRQASLEGDASEMPQSVFPLMWNFLLEPSDTIDPDSKESCVDFKSIASFMLVSRGTKQAFDDCNGWSLCLQAVKRDISAKEECIENFKNQAQPLISLVGTDNVLTTQELQMCRSLLDDRDDMRIVATRLTFIQNELLPKASSLAGTYCGERVPCPDYFKRMKIIYDVHGGLLEFIFTVLEARIQVQSTRRLLGLDLAALFHL